MYLFLLNKQVVKNNENSTQFSGYLLEQSMYKIVNTVNIQII
jgi:hypothetical protein